MVQLKKKVTIKQKHSEGHTPSTPPSGNGKYKKIALGVLLLLVASGVCWYALSDSKSSSNEVATAVQKKQDNVGASATKDRTETANEDSAQNEVSSERSGNEISNAEDVNNSKVEKTTENMTPNVNETEQATATNGTLEQKASDVIRGIYGNGQIRKEKLGKEYQTIQDKVNEMYRKGLVR